MSDNTINIPTFTLHDIRLSAANKAGEGTFIEGYQILDTSVRDNFLERGEIKWDEEGEHQGQVDILVRSQRKVELAVNGLKETRFEMGTDSDVAEDSDKQEKEEDRETRGFPPPKATKTPSRSKPSKNNQDNLSSDSEMPLLAVNKAPTKGTSSQTTIPKKRGRPAGSSKASTAPAPKKKKVEPTKKKMGTYYSSSSSSEPDYETPYPLPDHGNRSDEAGSEHDYGDTPSGSEQDSRVGSDAESEFDILSMRKGSTMAKPKVEAKAQAPMKKSAVSTSVEGVMTRSQAKARIPVERTVVKSVIGGEGSGPNKMAADGDRPVTAEEKFEADHKAMMEKLEELFG